MIDRSKLDKETLQKAYYMADFEKVSIETILDIAEDMAASKGVTIAELIQMVDDGFYCLQRS